MDKFFEIVNFVSGLSEGEVGRELNKKEKKFILENKKEVLKEMMRYDWNECLIESVEELIKEKSGLRVGM